MVLALVVHLLVFLLVGAAIDQGFHRWVRHPRVPPTAALAGGLILVGTRLAWLAAPAFNPLPPWEPPATGILRQTEYWLGWVLVVTLAVVGLWGLARLWWAYKQMRVFQEENPVAGTEVGSLTFFRFHRTRIHLEREYRRHAAAPKLELRFSWLTEGPLFTGASPILVMPMVLLEPQEGAFLEPLLDHEAEHIRLRHHWIYGPLAWIARLLPFFSRLTGSIGRVMVLRVDLAIRARADKATWSRYEQAIRRRKDNRLEWSAALALPRFAQEAEGRLAQVRGGPSWRLRHPFLIGGLVLSGVFTSAGLGHVSLHAIKEFLMHNQVKGYHYRLFDPLVSLHGLPSQGGAVPDGVEVDATRASGGWDISSVQAILSPKIPVGAQSVRITFDYEATRTSGDPNFPPSVSSRVMERRIQADGAREDLWVFDFRWRLLPEGKGTVVLDLLLCNPQPRLQAATSHLWGPDLGVPNGWRLRVTDWSLQPLRPDQVPPTNFPLEAEGFVAWYRHHKSPGPIHLSW